MKLLFIFFSMFCSFLFSYHLYLVNDSPFDLFAIIYAATGDPIGRVTLRPGEQQPWDSTKEVYNAKRSMTPFVVEWKCSYEGVYSINQNVSNSSVVKAGQGYGSKTCRKKSDIKKEDYPPCPPCPACPPCPFCPSEPPAANEKEPAKATKGPTQN